MPTASTAIPGQVTLAPQGRARRPVETLWAIAKALGVPFGQLIEPPAPDVRVVREGDGVRVQSAAAPYAAELLLAASRRGAFELYRLAADPGPVRQPTPTAAGWSSTYSSSRAACGWGPPSHPVELGPGDLASFAGDAPHIYETLAQGTRALLVMDYP